MGRAYLVIEEDLSGIEVLVSMHPDFDLAMTKLVAHVEQYKKDNPYHHVVKTSNHYGQYTDKGLTWWRIRSFNT